MILSKPKECKHCSREYLAIPEENRPWKNDHTQQTMGFFWECECGAPMFAFTRDVLKKDFRKFMQSEDTSSQWVNDLYKHLHKKIGA